MKFRLNVVQNSQNYTWIFDNVTNRFYDHNGNELLTEYEPKEYKKVIPFNRDHNEYRKSNNLTDLEIVLGMKCNFNCKYCSQHKLRDKCYDASPKDVEPFIAMLKRNHITANDIQFWGGEPLVYWKTIEKLVPRLREEYPKAHFYFPTNGSLLTRDKIDFINKYKINFSISHDGYCDENRDYDVLDNPVVKDAIEYARDTLTNCHFSFGATLQKNNVSPQKIIKFFKNKFGDKVTASAHNIMQCHDSSDPDTIQYTIVPEEQLKEVTENVFNLLNSNQQAKGYSYDNRRDRLISGWIWKEPIDAVKSECGHPFDRALACNMRGDILVCHSARTDQPIGHLDYLSECTNHGYRHFSYRQKCKDCLVVHSCCGGCPSSDDEGQERTCPNLYALYLGIFKASMAALFGVYLKSVEPVSE